MVGCIETEASGAALARRWVTTDGRSAARALFEAAAAGDTRAIQIRDEFSDHVAHALHLLALTFDVDLFVLGGGVSGVGDPLLRCVQGSLDRLGERSKVFRSLDLAKRLILAPARDVGVVGAAALVGLNSAP